MNFSWMNDRKKRLISTIALLVLIASVVVYNQRPEEQTEPVFSDYPVGMETANIGEEEGVEEKVEYISIDLKGAVLQQGVYELPQRSRVIDAIEMAGGFADDAEQRAINLAERLVDGQMIYVPKKEEAPEEQYFYSSGTQDRFTRNLISINRADENELTQLPGIGPARAASIVAYRKEKGKFQRKEDLLQISGIGQKTFDRLKELIVID